MNRSSASSAARWLVPALTALAVLLLPVSGYWFHQREAAALQNEAHDDLQSIAKLKVGQIERWLAERAADARIRSNGIIPLTTLQWLQNPNDELLHAALVAHCMRLRQSYHYSNVMLATPDGRLLLSMDPELMETEDEAARLARQAVTSGTVVLNDFFRCGRGERIYLDIAAPITNEDGAAVAVVILRTDANEMLFPLVQHWPGVSQTAETVLARRDGDHALILNELRRSPEPPLTVRIPLSETTRTVVQAVLGQSGFCRGLDYRGRDVLGVILPIAGSPWFMLAKVDADEVFKELRYRTGVIALLVALGILLAAGVGVMLHHRRQRHLLKDLLHAEIARRETGRKLDALLGNLTGMAFRCANDPDWTMEFVSAGCERLTGHPPDAIRNNALVSYASLIHPGDRDRIWDRVQKALPDPTPYGLTYRILHKSGEVRWVSETAVGVFDDSGALVAIEGYVQDITEARLAEEKLRLHREHLEELVAVRTADLEAVNRELEAFSYSVSHDLKSPLRSVDGFAGFLEEDYADKLDDEGRRLIRVIRDSAHEMAQLIDDLLTFSRLTHRELRVGPLDMEELARQAWERVQPDCAGREVDLRIAPLPEACGDTGTIREVLVNLLANAAKFTRGRETAVVEVGGFDTLPAEGLLPPPPEPPPADHAVFFVRDNGVGFDMAYRDKLFQVFQRLHNSRDYEGTGIGLALVRRIVQRHGGRVWANGEVDGGATFCFTLPKKELSDCAE